MTIETPRLLLRPFETADLRDLYAYAGRPGVGEMAGWRHHASLEESRSVLEEYLREPDTFAVVLRESGKVIGHLAVHEDSEDHRADTRELGFVLHPDYQRRGLMTEAVRGAVETLFGWGVRHVYACCFQDNQPSRGLIEKCGFRFEQAGTYYSRSLDKTFDSYEYVIHAEG